MHQKNYFVSPHQCQMPWSGVPAASGSWLRLMLSVVHALRFVSWLHFIIEIQLFESVSWKIERVRMPSSQDMSRKAVYICSMSWIHVQHNYIYDSLYRNLFQSTKPCALWKQMFRETRSCWFSIFDYLWVPLRVAEISLRSPRKFYNCIMKTYF